MKGHFQMKVRGSSKVNSQQVAFELKHKVLLALNKLSDRDTYQIGVEDLEKIVECLTPDNISPFLSCILDTGSEQKSAVRKECIRLMGTLASSHKSLIGSHLGKMVVSIVKRLKDPDTVVRDACVETMGILSSKFDSYLDQGDGVFVVLVKPLFEALGEQNKQIQSGSALCLARVIDSTHDPPVSILQPMLTRTIKLLNNPHFMAKPAAVELNRSIIQAGGAATKNVLSAAMSSIQQALKNTDWATRKAASVALGEIASGGGSFLGPFRASSIHSLESCRFDKVKPVRDSVLHALHCWKGLLKADTSEASEVGSSLKENFCGGDYNDTGTSGSRRKDVTLKKVAMESSKRIPLSNRKASQNYEEDHQHAKEDNWHIEIALPKGNDVSTADNQSEESEGSCVTKSLGKMKTDDTNRHNITYGFVPMDDKQEYSSVSNFVGDSFETKSVTVSHEYSQVGGLVKPIGRSQRFAAEEISSEEQLYSRKIRNRRSVDSSLTECSSQTTHGCCSQMANEMTLIRNQLLQMEKRQSSLMDHVQAFSTAIMDSISTLQSKVLSLEYVVDRIAQDVGHVVRYSDTLNSRHIKQKHNVSSPRLSTCTPSPRPSVQISNRQSSLSSAKNSVSWEEKEPGTSRLSNSAKPFSEIRTNPSAKVGRKATEIDALKSTRHMGQMTKNDALFASALSANVTQNSIFCKNGVWQRVKGFLCEGELESAYMEALSSRDELVLVELLDKTGPVLESLSPDTASEILSTSTSYLLEHRFTNSIIPWLQQVVDLSAIHGPNYLVPSAKAKHELLTAIHEALNMEFSNPSERRLVTQIATRLRQLWGIAKTFIFLIIIYSLGPICSSANLKRKKKKI